MRAVVLSSYGPPPQLGVQDIPPPHAEAWSRAHCACTRSASGFPDALMVAGKYQVKPEAPYTPGNETAGVVTEVAPDVQSVQAGRARARDGGAGRSRRGMRRRRRRR